MPSPTFNGRPIFDSIAANNSRFSEGVLSALDYLRITQTIHFQGEDGNRLIEHGYPDREWEFRGLLSAPSLIQLKGLFDDIQTAIDDGGDGNYQTLVDSFGDSHESAQVMSFHRTPPQITADGGYVCPVVVRGIILGMEHDG